MKKGDFLGHLFRKFRQKNEPMGKIGSNNKDRILSADLLVEEL